VPVGEQVEMGQPLVGGQDFQNAGARVVAHCRSAGW
jgi:hypothetical protein